MVVARPWRTSGGRCYARLCKRWSCEQVACVCPKLPSVPRVAVCGMGERHPRAAQGVGAPTSAPWPRLCWFWVPAACLPQGKAAAASLGRVLHTATPDLPPAWGCMTRSKAKATGGCRPERKWRKGGPSTPRCWCWWVSQGSSRDSGGGVARNQPQGTGIASGTQ